jgi:hypothetical protein
MRLVQVQAMTGLAIVAAAVALASPAYAAKPKSGSTVTEQVGGYKMVLTVGAKSISGRMTLICVANGSSAGSASFKFAKHGKFVAQRLTKSGTLVWRFRGRFDGSRHFIGSGSSPGHVCGASVASSWSEGPIGEARMVTCPQSDSEHPYPSNTPFTFTGLVPNAAAGTHLRVEYTNPDGSTAVDHVLTDPAGNFSDTHAFPTGGDFPWGADAIPRYPDDGLAPGNGCSFAIL